MGKLIDRGFYTSQDQIPFATSFIMGANLADSSATPVSAEEVARNYGVDLDTAREMLEEAARAGEPLEGFRLTPHEEAVLRTSDDPLTRELFAEAKRVLDEEAAKRENEPGQVPQRA
jgi:hypothetical protein